MIFVSAAIAAPAQGAAVASRDPPAPSRVGEPAKTVPTSGPSFVCRPGRIPAPICPAQPPAAPPREPSPQQRTAGR